MRNTITPQCPYQGFQFPFKTNLSFAPILRFWAEDDRLKNGWGKEMYQKIQQYLEQYPELAQPITDTTLLEKHKDFVETLMLAIFPPGLYEDEIVAAVQPFSMDVIYATPPFRQSFLTEEGALDTDNADFDYDELLYYKTVSAFMLVFKQFYNNSIDQEGSMTFSVRHPETQLDRYYKIELNTRFVEVKQAGVCPVLSKKETKKLMRHFEDISLWLEKIPPEQFEIQGLAVIRFVDVTTEESIASLKYQLLEDDSLINPQKFLNVKQLVRNLVGIPDLEVGVSVFNQHRNVFIESEADTQNSLLLTGLSSDADCESYFGDFPCQLETERKPLFFEDLNEVENPPPFVESLKERGLRNLFVAPLYQGDVFVGLLELATPNPGTMGTMAAIKLSDILPMFSIAVKRNADKLENRIQSIIKERFTAIHPAVEWKFVEAATTLLQAQNHGENIDTKPIVFPEVYPLYAASDIRNSSTERSKAIQQDLLAHLQLASEVTEKGYAQYRMPILDELNYKVDRYHHQINEGLYSGDEIEVLEFLQKEVEPCLRHIETTAPNDAVNDALTRYWDAIKNPLGILYQRRKAFEDSLTQINETISAVIDTAETEAQAMFPHYFEKYKTDGVEYNIYVGDSLAQHHNFDPVHLRNLRLWQLMTTYKAAVAAENIRQELPIPLQTTHLILIQSNPLAIKFRTDEKKFDVDGAYNIRYEIVKKRIDKAVIKGTNERLTQPGKIAMVYSQPKEAEEYRGYLHYLAARKYILPDIEELELEDLQGVQGLKGLRVTIEMPATSLNGTVARKKEKITGVAV